MLMTGQDDNLMLLTCKCQRGEGVSEPAVICINKSIIQNDRSINPFIGEKIGEGNPGDHWRVARGCQY